MSAAQHFADTVIVPDARAWERAGQVPRSALRAAADAGLTGLLVAPEHGGVAISKPAFMRVLATLAAADMATTFVLVVHNNLAQAVSTRAPVALRRRWLPDMLAGSAQGAFLLTEPDAGSDAAAIRTRAVRDGSGWRIDGAKAWVTAGTSADLLSVYVQTDPDAGARGIAAFLLAADTPGIRRLPAYDMLGGHALGAAGFEFDGVAVSADELMVAPGEGFGAAMAGIDLARAGVAAMCCGMLDASLGLALARAGERHAFGRPLADFQGLQWQLADVATDLEAARLLVAAAADALQGGRPATLPAAHAKKFATRVALNGISTCMQVLGASGLRHDTALPRHLTGARIAQYLDGTTEIQNVVISRALFGRPRAPAGD